MSPTDRRRATSLRVNGPRKLIKALRDNGFSYDERRKRIKFVGPGRPGLPFDYVGADDEAGPNYTGQPAVDSHYR